MKFTDAQEFGQIIRKKRKELNYTQSYISELTLFDEVVELPGCID